MAVNSPYIILFQKKHSQNKTKATFEPPDIFTTEDYIKSPQPIERVKYTSDENETTQVAMDTSKETGAIDNSDKDSWDLQHES